MGQRSPMPAQADFIFRNRRTASASKSIKREAKIMLRLLSGVAAHGLRSRLLQCPRRTWRAGWRFVGASSACSRWRDISGLKAQRRNLRRGQLPHGARVYAFRVGLPLREIFSSRLDSLVRARNGHVVVLKGWSPKHDGANPWDVLGARRRRWCWDSHFDDPAGGWCFSGHVSTMTVFGDGYNPVSTPPDCKRMQKDAFQGHFPTDGGVRSSSGTQVQEGGEVRQTREGL